MAAYARIHLLLAFLGLYIAGMLSMSHLLGMQLPCGIGSGCDIVTQDPRSKLLGVPFAYYGLMGYGSIALIAFVRLFAPGRRQTVLNSLGYLLSGAGLLVSLGLTVFSLRTIHAFCTWCIASAVTMSILFAFYAFAAMKPPASQRRAASVGDGLLCGAALLLLTGSLLLSARKFKNEATTTYVDQVALKEFSEEDLAPIDAHRRGPAGAPFTVVMFGDLTCPVCESAYHDLSGLVRRRKDFQLVFRHLPLYFHPLARPAANLSELAADKGKFWEFAGAMYGSEPSSEDGLVRIAESLGVTNARTRMNDASQPALNRVNRDMAVAGKLGLHSTPSIFVLREGYFPEPSSFYSVSLLLDNVLEQERKTGDGTRH